jgi:preprotein translocase subunit YajC
MGAQQASMPQQNLFGILIMWGVIICVIYFLVIRPQKKLQQEHAKMLSALEKNDEVVTTGGIYGTIVNIQNEVVTLRVDDNTKIRVDRNAVARIKKQS